MPTVGKQRIGIVCMDYCKTLLIYFPILDTAWRRCALDLVCAANTIRSYINRFGKVITILLTQEFLVSLFSLQDCNGDQLVTCEDYVMIHKNGGWNCGKSLAGSKFFDIFQTCKEVVISRGLNI